jgi:hypothetical protein
MDIGTVLAELRQERDQITEAIMSLVSVWRSATRKDGADHQHGWSLPERRLRQEDAVVHPGAKTLGRSRKIRSTRHLWQWYM